MKTKILLILLFSVMLSPVSGQDVKFSAKAPEVVGLNEHFKLTYTINTDDAKNLQVPAFPAFESSGPSRSTRTNIKYVNGKVSREVRMSFSYYMKPKKTGTFTIGPASIEVNGKTYRSNEVTIKVIKEKSKQQQKQSGKQQQQQKQQSKRRVTHDEVFLRLHLNKSPVYRGDHIAATLKIYTKLDITSIQNYEAPPFNGFWSNEINTPSNINFSREKYNGEIYHSGVMSKYLLFPQQTGKITIDPAKLKLVVRKQVKQPSFFDSGHRNIEVRLRSPERTVQVKSLPAGAPASFNGAVGNFNIKAEVTKEKLKANESLNYKITVSGDGNIKLIEPFEIAFPSDFDEFEPEISQNIKNTASGASGYKTFDYLLIPRYAGNFTIPSVEFTYFNPATGKYRTQTTPSFQIEVGEGKKGSGTVVTSRGSKEELKILDHDIRYIKQDALQLQPVDTFFFGSSLFWGIYGIAAFGFVVFLFVYLRRRKRLQNAELVRNRQASKISQKRLKTAHKAMKAQDEQTFYEEVLKALWGYASDKLNIKLADLNRETLMRELKKYNVPEQVMNLFGEVLDTCEYARYAPSAASGGMEGVYNKAGKVIRQLENHLK